MQEKECNGEGLLISDGVYSINEVIVYSSNEL